MYSTGECHPGFHSDRAYPGVFYGVLSQKPWQNPVLYVYLVIFVHCLCKLSSWVSQLRQALTPFWQYLMFFYVCHNLLVMMCTCSLQSTILVGIITRVERVSFLKMWDTLADFQSSGFSSSVRFNIIGVLQPGNHQVSISFQ